MKNTEIKEMNIEELGLVTGGLSCGDLYNVVKDTLNSDAPKEIYTNW